MNLILILFLSTLTSLCSLQPRAPGLKPLKPSSPRSSGLLQIKTTFVPKLPLINVTVVSGIGLNINTNFAERKKKFQLSENQTILDLKELIQENFPGKLILYFALSFNNYFNSR